MKYTIKDFNKDFPDDSACLDYIFNLKYGDSYACKTCKKTGSYYRTKKRKSYSCSWCGTQVNPTAGTIFHKSSTSLTTWFYAVFLMSQAKNGVAAMELKRMTGVTYKTAWRMASQIRKLMEQGGDMLSGTIEADETYVGGKAKGKRGRGAKNKTPVFGMVERQGSVKAAVVPNVRAVTLLPIMQVNVQPKSNMMTDDLPSYHRVQGLGLHHEVVRHGIKEYVRGKVHTNTIEGFWSQMKRSISGTYHAVSPKHLQAYVDEFAYRYNYRGFEALLFHFLLQRVVAA